MAETSHLRNIAVALEAITDAYGQLLEEARQAENPALMALLAALVNSNQYARESILRTLSMMDSQKPPKHPFGIWEKE